MNLLYYPRIAIPMNELKKYTLYCEGISSIVPNEYKFRAHGSDPNWDESIGAMLYLESEGVYQKTDTQSVLSSHGRQLKKEFVRRVNNYKNSDEFLHGNYDSTWWQLYLGKMDSDVVKYLFEEGMAEKSSQGTIDVIGNVAAIYMGLFADYASTYGEELYSTVTSKSLFKELVYKPISDNDRTLKLKFSLSSILPVPNEDASIQDILLFRKSRSNELKRFQMTMQGYQKQLGTVEDIREYRELVETIETDLLLQTSDLKSLLRENNIRFTTNCIDAFLNVPQKIISSFVSNKGFVRITPLAEKKLKRESDLRNSPVSYLLLAESDGII